MQNAKEVRHPNGLTVKVPEGFAAKQTDDGLVIEPEGDKNSQVRRPVAVYVSVIKGKGVPEGATLRTKALRGKEVRYLIDKSEGGSGGETYSLEAYEARPDGYIEYTQTTQSEYGEPDFATCWSIVESTKVDETRKN